MEDKVNHIVYDLNEIRTIIQSNSSTNELITQDGIKTIPDFIQAGNFIYEITNSNFAYEQAATINVLNTKGSIKERINAIRQCGGDLQFATLEQDIFKNNLILIDSLLPNILAEMVTLFYSSDLCSIRELTSALNHANPIEYDTCFAHPFYASKIKRFLIDMASGMTTSTVWDGHLVATSDYQVVKDAENPSHYRLYNRPQLEEYLFMHARLDTPSSSRHRFGKIYEKNGRLYLNLNLQIRFLQAE